MEDFHLQYLVCHLFPREFFLFFVFFFIYFILLVKWVSVFEGISKTLFLVIKHETLKTEIKSHAIFPSYVGVSILVLKMIG